MKHSTKLGLIIAIALFSAILEFGFGLALVAHYYGNWDFDRLIYVKRNDQNLTLG